MEIGYFRKLKSIHVTYYHEGFPIWLLLFDALECLTVNIHGVSSWAGFEAKCLATSDCTHDLFQQIVSAIGREKFRFGDGPVDTVDSTVPTLVLVSGRFEFLSLILETVTDNPPLVYVLDKFFSGRIRKGQPSGCARNWPALQWTQLQHLVYGGPTDFVMLMGARGVIVQTKLSSLRRSIRDVFAASIKPSPVTPREVEIAQTGSAANSPTQAGFYRMDDVLRTNHLDLELIHTTHFLPNGWGRRRLSIEEVAAAYGYPRSYHIYLHKGIFQYPPYQMLLVIFRSASDSLTSTGQKETSPQTLNASHKLSPQSHSSGGREEDQSSWLPSISRWLPKTWIGAPDESSKAAKNDEACVPTHLWNSRILSVFPSATPLVPLLREMCLRRARRNLLRDYLDYLRLRYGIHWQRIVQYHRVSCSNSRIGGDTADTDTDTSKTDTSKFNKIIKTDPVKIHIKTSQSITNQSTSHLEGEDSSSDCDWEDPNADDITVKHQNTLHRNKHKTDVITPEEAQLTLSVTDVITSKNIGTLLATDIEKGIEAIEKYCNASWWEWSMGSSLFYWRWNDQEIDTARDGMQPFVAKDLPNWKTKRQVKRVKEPKRALIIKKLKTIIERRYIIPGKVVSWTDYFDVPKGDDDIRLVYNGSSCGLNQALWAPNFWLPFPRSATRLLDFNYFSGDIDLGEMFHNFPLHETIQEYSGIDLSSFKNELNLDVETASDFRWTKTWMGARSSPYCCVRYFYLAEEFVRGNHLDPNNEMRWDTIMLNLPGDKLFDPSKPRVRKWDTTKMRIAGDLITFVDDGRTTGEDIEHAWGVLRQVTSRIQYRGIQAALRKIKAPRRNPGPWAGAVFETTDHTITRSVTIEKWNKAKSLIERLWEQLLDPSWETKKLSYKDLEITRGFLCHMSMTFEIIVPYLKGFHLTLASHLNKRDKEGWKHTDKAWKLYVDHKIAEGVLMPHEGDRMLEGVPYVYDPPSQILPVMQLKDDVYAIREFLSSELPPKISERSKDVQIVRYGFGDASGSGFGSTIESDDGLKYRIGIWGSDDDDESSNFKELENVVSTIEDEVASGNLNNSVLFFFTDNSTVEAALHKGNSSNKKLFLLVVRFRKVQFLSGLNFVVSHVSGKRMIAQGTDGVSRGNLNEGVGTGREMLQFIPLHLNALERHPGLENWIRSWAGPELEVLKPMGWFTRGHDHDGGQVDKRGFWHVKVRKGLFLWAPPPAAAEVALEELRKAIIKRQESTHIFVSPRLLTTEWMKQLHKTSDLLISIPAGGYQEIQSEGLSKADNDRLESAWGTLQKQKAEFCQAREGDHLLVPFECDYCIFQKLRGKEKPDVMLTKDRLLMACIRRIILDSFWSRATSTVLGNRDRAKAALRLSELVGLKGPFEHTTTLPDHDHCGYEVAIEMVLDSTNPGRYSKDHKQWDTIRKLRTVYSSQAKASPQANISTLAFGDERGRAQRLVIDKCSSYWFSRFFSGCKRRMGQDWRPNKAMSIELILKLIDLIREKIREPRDASDKHNWVVFGTYLIVTYTMSLRGVEGLLLDIKGLQDHLNKGDGSYFVIALLGKIKGEHHHRCHLLPCVNVTSSGIRIKDWILLLLNQMDQLGFKNGPAIADMSGNVRTCAQMDDYFIDILEEAFEENPTLFPPSLNNKEEIATSYSVFRSPRRSSDTRAIEKNVSQTDIMLFNRWSVVEKAQGNRAAFPMHQHYAQVELLVEPFKRYTWAM